MSTYNSKFSGAKIDEILGKAEELATLHEEGQLGGGGSGGAEKDAFVKECGATHKHTITVNVTIDAVISIRCVVYNKAATAFTVNTLTTYFENSGVGVNGFCCMYIGGNHFFVSDVVWCISREGAGLIAAMGSLAQVHSYVGSVDFENQTYTESSISLISPTEMIPIATIIDEMGGTFTDDVTEL